MLTVFYILSLIIFALLTVSARTTVSKLRYTSGYNARLLPFTYFSLSSWVLVALQLIILIANQFVSFPNGFLLDTGLWLGFMQNALWIGAVLSLHSKEFSLISRALPLTRMFPIMVAWALLTFRITVLDSEAFINIVTVSVAVTFIVFAYSILSSLQWRLRKIAAAIFLIHGFSQSIWSFVWLTPRMGRIAIVVAFSLWHIALVVIWTKLISAMLDEGESSYQQVAESATKLSSQLTITFTRNPLVSILFSVLFTLALRLSVEIGWSYLNGFWTIWEVRTVGTLLVSLAGGLLYLFRKHFQMVYGVSEIFFALLVTCSQIAKAQIQRDLAAWIAVVASAFLIVRGITNYQEGKKKQVAETEF